MLGRLYKKVARLADAQDDDDSNIAVEPLEPALPQPTFDVDAFDRSLLADGYEARLWQARKLKEAYEWELAKLMQRNGIRAEAEVVTGHVMHLADFQKRRKLSEVRDRLAERPWLGASISVEAAFEENSFAAGR